MQIELLTIINVLAIVFVVWRVKIALSAIDDIEEITPATTSEAMMLCAGVAVTTGVGAVTVTLLGFMLSGMPAMAGRNYEVTMGALIGLMCFIFWLCSFRALPKVRKEYTDAKAKKALETEESTDVLPMPL